MYSKGSGPKDLPLSGCVKEVLFIKKIILNRSKQKN